MDGKWKAGTSGLKAAQGSNAIQPINIQLDEQSRKFALDSSLPLNGELHINDGTVDFHGNNLKSGTNYKLIFIGRRYGSSVYKIIGDIIPDRHGAAGLQCKINPADIDGEGTDLSCFYIFMVAAMGSPIKPVLKGDLIKPQMNSKELYGMKSPGISEAGRSGTAFQIRNFNTYYSEYILEKTAALADCAAGITLISPFDDVWLADNWRRETDLMKLPIASVGAEKQIIKYGHFIFASAEDNFYVAVPGRHTDEDWPDRGRSGFMLWQSIRGSGEYGYWAIVIDRKTGAVKLPD